MIGKIAGVIIAISVFFGVATGRGEMLGEAALDGAANAISLTVTLVGMMCLWCGILKVLREAGTIGMLTKITDPLLKMFFPEASKHKEISEDIAANIAANMLGVGNAATPLALSAMQKLQEINPDPNRASEDMITLAVLNTSSVSLVPSTVLAILRAAGASDPFSVVLPIWLTSFTCALVSLVLCRIAAFSCRVGGKSKILVSGRVSKNEIS
jgi:spore maturation protein A